MFFDFLLLPPLPLSLGFLAAVADDLLSSEIAIPAAATASAYRAFSPAMFRSAAGFVVVVVVVVCAGGTDTGTGALTAAASDKRRRALAASIRLKRPLSLALGLAVVEVASGPAPAPRRPAGSVMAQDVTGDVCSFDNN